MKEGRRVRLRKGKLTTTDAPFVKTKEVIGGFAVLKARSMDEAIEVTNRFLAIRGDEWDLQCEVRKGGAVRSRGTVGLYELALDFTSPGLVAPPHLRPKRMSAKRSGETGQHAAASISAARYSHSAAQTPLH